ncbi:uncharacterized protein LOC109513826 isoform X1 [Hippocampus comes]|uniref:uncharacterized protein LOC109513826 isoform X1 n=2 Tax=Hippocampus comes TaxID=109280 RepID=UPI00094F1BCE|nr:PREDICTED: uncharacterized protein LOC109513826 isoform X1 [Hippocampus comes]
MRRDDDATFSDLLDLSFGGPRAGALDLVYLRRLLLALLSRLGIRDVSAAERARQTGLLERVGACEDALEQALGLARDVQEQMSVMKQRAEELHVRQQGLASASLDELKDEGALLRARVDALETAKADKEQMDVLRRLIGDTDRREACRLLDERVKLHEDAIERLTQQCRQLDDLRGALDRMMSSLTSEPSDLRCRSTDDLNGKLSLLLERKMAETVRWQRHEDAQLTGGPVSILKLQSECDKLQEAIRRLHDDSKHKQVHIQQLVRTSEDLQENKVDKRLLHVEVKKQLDEAQLKNFHRSRERLRSPEDFEHDGEDATAAGIRKQLLETHHCLSCDRHVIRHLNAAKSLLGAWPSGRGGGRPLTDLTHFRYPRVSRSCGGIRTVTYTPQRRLNGAGPRGQTPPAGPVQPPPHT